MIFSRALCNSGHQEDRRDVVKDFRLGLTVNSYLNMRNEYSCNIERSTLLRF